MDSEFLLCIVSLIGEYLVVQETTFVTSKPETNYFPLSLKVEESLRSSFKLTWTESSSEFSDHILSVCSFVSPSFYFWSFQYFLQNVWANFVQTWPKAPEDKGGSNVWKQKSCQFSNWEFFKIFVGTMWPDKVEIIVKIRTPCSRVRQYLGSIFYTWIY